ncbi:MAG: serine acetyltransferase [Proteobacteria bacterium]|nr:serine acetyltransferase [Pseudomonadota bacterium]
MMQPKAGLFADIWLDMQMILAYENKPQNLRNILWAWFACDAFIILMSFRLRKWIRRHHIPLLNRVIRLLQTAFFAIELGNDIELGHGVYFVHSVGTVVGGDARIGDACVFFGNNTVGAARFQGSPRIGAGTVIGAGVRILGKIEVGENCYLGANAVVVDNIPRGKIAVGVPARVIADNLEQSSEKSREKAV